MIFYNEFQDFSIKDLKIDWYFKKKIYIVVYRLVRVNFVRIYVIRANYERELVLRKKINFGY